MRSILIIILAILALSIAVTLIGPIMVLSIGAILTYYAYQHLVKSNNSVLGIIWWVMVGATGVSMFAGALPGFMFMGAIVTFVYFAFRKSNKSAQPNVKAGQNEAFVFSEYESFEAEWRDITRY